MIISPVKRKISCCTADSSPLYLHVFSMMISRSFVGMFVYILEISREAILRSGVIGDFG